MKKKYYVLISIYVVLLFAITTSIFNLVIMVAKEKEVINVDNRLEEKKSIPKYITKNYYQEKDNVKININLPHSNSKEFNNKIDKIKNKYLGYIKEEENSKNNATNLDLNMTYTVNKYNDDILSFIIHTEIYTGGAHPNTYIHTITYNFKKNKEIILEEMFKNNPNYLAKISEISIQKLLKEEKIKEYFIDDYFYEALAPKKENFKNFALDNNSIIFFFERYQIAPYAAGEFTVCIDLEDLKFDTKLL